MFSNAFALLALACATPAALAKIFITQPVASTVWPVGTQVTVQWQDDNSAPLLPAIGVCNLGIYAGNQIQQTLLQAVGTFDVSKQNSISFTINGDIGPSNVHSYFMRFTSQGLADPANPQFPEQAFSAMFAVSGSTGTFNATVQAEIDGASTAGAVGGGPVTPVASGSAAAGGVQTSTVVVGATQTAKSASAAGAKATGAQAGASASNAAGNSLSWSAILVSAGAFAAFFL